MRLREAGTEDRATLLDFRREVYDGDPDGEYEIDGVLADPLTALLIAEDDEGRSVGFVEVGLRSFAEGCVTSPVGYIEGLYVVPDARRSGIARALLQGAEAWARDQNCREMASDVRIDNTISEAVHHDAGYETVERIICLRKVIDGP